MAIALDASVHGNTTAASLGLSLTTATAGDVILAFVTTNGGPVTGVSGSTLGAFSSRKQQLSSDGGTSYIELWYKVAAGTLAGETITTSTTSSAYLTVDIAAFSGCNTATPFDVNGSLPNGVASGLSTVSTTAASTCVVGGYRLTGSGNGSAGSGFTQVGGGDYQLVEYQLFSSAQSGLSITVTGANGENGGIGDALQQAGAAAAVNTRRTMARLGARVGTRSSW